MPLHGSYYNAIIILQKKKNCCVNIKRSMTDSAIKFELHFDNAKSRSSGREVEAIFDYRNPFTKCVMSRSVKFRMNSMKREYYIDTLQPYVKFLIDNNMLTPEMLTLNQDKLMQYILFGYPQSYGHTRKSVPPGISRYFRRTQYDRHCLTHDPSKGSIIPKGDDEISKYPRRLLAPQESGTTTLIIGSSYTGKSYLLSQEISLLKPYEYDLILIFTESLHVPEIAKLNERPDVVVKEGFDERIPLFLKNLNSKLGNRFRFLLVLDDIISEKSNRQSVLGAMLTTFRNSNISSCVLIQYPTLISKESRSNFHQLVLTGMRSLESNKSFADRFDIISWAKDRMRHENVTSGHTIRNEDVFSYLKKLLMVNGVVVYIDLKRSKDPALVDLR